MCTEYRLPIKKVTFLFDFLSLTLGDKGKYLLNETLEETVGDGDVQLIGNG